MAKLDAAALAALAALAVADVGLPTALVDWVDLGKSRALIL